MSDEPEKSIAQIIAEIKAKVHALDAQINAIDTRKLPEESDLVWHVALQSATRLRANADNFPADFKTEWDAKVAIFHLHSATATLHSSLDTLDANYAELSGEMPAELHAILADINLLLDSYDILANRIITRH